MEKPEFDITIDKDGRLKVHVKGAHGKDCLKLADLIKEIIGKEESRQLTSDYYGGDEQVRINVEVRNRKS